MSSNIEKPANLNLNLLNMTELSDLEFVGSIDKPFGRSFIAKNDKGESTQKVAFKVLFADVSAIAQRELNQEGGPNLKNLDSLTVVLTKLSAAEREADLAANAEMKKDFGYRILTVLSRLLNFGPHQDKILHLLNVINEKTIDLNTKDQHLDSQLKQNPLDKNSKESLYTSFKLAKQISNSEIRDPYLSDIANGYIQLATPLRDRGISYQALEAIKGINDGALKDDLLSKLVIAHIYSHDFNVTGIINLMSGKDNIKEDHTAFAKTIKSYYFGQSKNEVLEELNKIKNSQTKDHAIENIIQFESCNKELTRILMPLITSEDLRVKAQAKLDDDGGEAIFKIMIEAIENKEQNLDIDLMQKIKNSANRSRIFDLFIRNENFDSAKKALPHLHYSERHKATETLVSKLTKHENYAEAIELAGDKSDLLKIVFERLLEKQNFDLALEVILKMGWDKGSCLNQLFALHISLTNLEQAENVVTHMTQFKEIKLRDLKEAYKKDGQNEKADKIDHLLRQMDYERNKPHYDRLKNDHNYRQF
jgi:hypothetical protein